MRHEFIVIYMSVNETKGSSKVKRPVCFVCLLGCLFVCLFLSVQSNTQFFLYRPVLKIVNFMHLCAVSWLFGCVVCLFVCFSWWCAHLFSCTLCSFDCLGIYVHFYILFVRLITNMVAAGGLNIG